MINQNNHYMSPKSMVKWSNRLGLLAIILLFYWVFVFTVISVFKLRIFREHLTESFYLSILSILALMVGALIVNIMFNLTRIAERHNADEGEPTRNTKFPAAQLLGWSLPLILGLLFGGDALSAHKKKKMLIASAESIISTHQAQNTRLVNYTFSEAWILEAADLLDRYARSDRNFPNVALIVADSLQETPVYLQFSSYEGNLQDTIQPRKKDFILATTAEERQYLQLIFSQQGRQVRFSARDGQYELFFPFQKNGRMIVLYFSDYQEYGKIGS